MIASSLPSAGTINDLLQLLTLLQLPKDPKKVIEFWEKVGEERRQIEQLINELHAKQATVEAQHQALDKDKAAVELRIDVAVLAEHAAQERQVSVAAEIGNLEEKQVELRATSAGMDELRRVMEQESKLVEAQRAAAERDAAEKTAELDRRAAALAADADRVETLRRELESKLATLKSLAE